MKPVFFFCFIAALFLTQPSFAQKKDKKDKQTTSTKATTAKTSTTSTKVMKKDGTPDMRYKKNKEAVQMNTNTAATQRPPTTTSTRMSKTSTSTQRSSPVPVNNPPVSSSVPVQGQNKSADRAVGTDSKGRTIYEGPKGGRYYINANGNKEYVKH